MAIWISMTDFLVALTLVSTPNA